MSQESVHGPDKPMPAASHKRRRVAAIGAGPSGLVAAKSLKEEGLEPVVLEQADALGGQWYGPSAHSGVWPGMRANTSKTLDTFSDFPPAESLPMFPRVEELRDYLHAYAKAFDLNRFIRFNTPVRCTERDDDGWRVVTGDGGGERFDGVVVASGRFNRPHWPAIAGLETFAGEVVHSFHYRGRDAFRGKRVVVLGNGVSGTEIASDLAIDDAIRVTAAFRKPRYVIPRVSCGVLSDWRFFTRFSAYLPLALPPEAVALSQEAGMAPDLAARPEITRHLLFGPLAPAQFHLDGHGRRADALALYKQAIGAFGGDTSPVPTAEELTALRQLVGTLGDRAPELGAALQTLERLAAQPR